MKAKDKSGPVQSSPSPVQWPKNVILYSQKLPYRSLEIIDRLLYSMYKLQILVHTKVVLSQNCRKMYIPANNCHPKVTIIGYCTVWL